MIEAPDKFNLVQRGVNAGDVGPLKAVQVPDGNPAAAGRWLHVNANGSFFYVPPAGFVGTDWFTYKLEDEQRNAGQLATVFIRMRPFNSAISVGDRQPGDPEAVIPGPGAVGEPIKFATVHLRIPNDTPRGSQVVFFINSDVQSKVRVYQGDPNTKGSIVVVGEGAETSHTWTVGDEKNPPPPELYAAGLGPTEFGQIQMRMNVYIQDQVGDGRSK